jgi:hypothetical protein
MNSHSIMSFKFHTPLIKYKYKENMKLKLKTFQFPHTIIMFKKF